MPVVLFPHFQCTMHPNHIALQLPPLSFFFVDYPPFSFPPTPLSLKILFSCLPTPPDPPERPLFSCQHPEGFFSFTPYSITPIHSHSPGDAFEYLHTFAFPDVPSPPPPGHEHGVLHNPSGLCRFAPLAVSEHKHLPPDQSFSCHFFKIITCRPLSVVFTTPGSPPTL